jgi:poly(A) polymerase
MDPIDVLDACNAVAHGRPCTFTSQVCSAFSAGDFEAAWQNDPVRVRKILDDILTSPSPGTGMEFLLRSGAFGALFPEIQAIRGLGDDPEASLHKDVWEHTKQVVAGVPNQLELRWAALLHDIGKARTRRVSKGGRVTFHGHDVVGYHMVAGIQRRLQLFRSEELLYEGIRALVLNHLRPHGYDKKWSDSGVRRLLCDLGGPQGFDRLLVLARADLTTKNPTKRAKALARTAELQHRMMKIYNDDSAPRLPKGTMGFIIERSGKPAGPWTADVKSDLEARLLDGRLPIDQPPEFYVEAWLKITSTEGKDILSA